MEPMMALTGGAIVMRAFRRLLKLVLTIGILALLAWALGCLLT